jgi:hypothetical protein
MKPLISIIHASYGRPEKALRAMRLWLERAVNPERVEYIFALNTDDPKNAEYMRTLDIRPPSVRIIHGDFHGSAPAWNIGSGFAKGALLIQASDDLIPMLDWDLCLSKRIEWEAGPDWTRLPVFVAVSDGYRLGDHELVTSAIMTLVYAEQKGSFIPPEYVSMWSDDEVLYRAKRDARDGRVKLINARDLVFLHRHHVHDKGVPDDDTYRRTGSAEAYGKGSALFWSRNPEARTDGLRTWK